MLLVTHDRALLDAVSGRRARDRVRAPRRPTRAAGPSTCGCASSPPSRRPSRRAARAARGAATPCARARRGPSPLELVEREIARTEERIGELERQLAEDWTNVDLVSAHRAARDELTALLARWERLFEETQAALTSKQPRQRSSGAIVSP